MSIRLGLISRWCSLLILCCATYVNAQMGVAVLSGIVTDPTGALVPGAKVTLSSATELMDELSVATVLICSSATLLTSRIERTAPLAAIATPGRIARSGIVVYANAGMMPMSADPARNAAAQVEGTV